MIDPLILRIIALGFALLFLFAAAHKLGDRAHFRASLRAYEIVPAGLLGLAASVIPLLELAVGFGWLAHGLLGFRIAIVSLLSIVLLASYTAAIGTNLLRGRNYIDCGCSFSHGEFSNSANGSQQISTGLLLRNLLLVAMAMASTLPSGERTLQLIDYAAAVFAVITLTLIYGAFNQLLVNDNAIDSWRQKHA